MRVVHQRFAPRKLLAVTVAVSLNASASAGCAKTEGAPIESDPSADENAQVRDAAALEPASAVLQPRVLDNGRPACGNTGGKGENRAECAKP